MYFQNSLLHSQYIYRISGSESPKLPWQRALPHNGRYISRGDYLQWAHVIIDGSKSCCQCFWNSPGGVRPRWGGEGRRLSTAQSSFPLKLQLCTATTRPSSCLPVWQPCTATRLDPVVHHGRSGNPAPCNQTLHQGLESPAGPSWGSAIAGFADWPVRTLLQEGMPGHSTLF